jgi:SAM-dependent methyltransferase
MSDRDFIRPKITDKNSGIYGHVDFVNSEGIGGWLIDVISPEPRVVEVYVNDEKIGEAIANLQRPDIASIIGREANCGFFVKWSQLDVPREISLEDSLEVAIIDKLSGKEIVGKHAKGRKPKFFKKIEEEKKEKIVSHTIKEIHEHVRDMKEFFGLVEEINKRRHLSIDSILDDILKNGIYDPLLEIYYPPNVIQITSENYRETINAGKLVSRTRAVLFEYKCLAKKIPILNSYNNVIIYAPEAFSSFALYMRDIFPRFIGSEYGISSDEAFPIPVEDLCNLSFDSETFHCVIVNDIFEHIPFVRLKKQALPEIYRILKKDGVLLSTFPFTYNTYETIIKAYVLNDVIHYIGEPEYHGNPVTGKDDSLVFSILGWDILDICKDIGFSDVYMSFTLSARYGILPIIGVLVAIK